MSPLSLRLFIRISELGSITSAAADLGLSPASASTRLSKLEESLGARLFHRTTREVTLTADGAEFLPYAQEALELLETGVAMITGKTERARGLLRISMPGSFGRMYIVPALEQFCARYPDISLDLRLSDEVQDIVKGAFDLVIRNAPLEDSGLVARKLANDRRILVASPNYLENYGHPESPEELVNHRQVTFPGDSQWSFENHPSIRVTPSTAVNDGEAMRLLLESGAGIGVKSLWNARGSLQAGSLVHILPEFPLMTRSAIWAVHPSGRILAPKVRVMIDFLVTLFSPLAPWETG